MVLNLGSVCFKDLKRFQLEHIFHETTYFPVFSCHTKNVSLNNFCYLVGTENETFSAGGDVFDGVGAGRRSMSGVCHGASIRLPGGGC